MVLKRFYHNVWAPYERLKSRAAENVCVEPGMNDVVSLAAQVAIAAFHFREASFRLAGSNQKPMVSPEGEKLRQKLCDIADTTKHGVLRDSTRMVQLSASLAYEFNDLNKFRFLRTEIVARNERFGEFEVCDLVEAFLPHLADEFELPKPEKISLPVRPFVACAETFLTKSSGFGIEGVRLHFYRRNSSGILLLADPPEVCFAVLEREN